MWKVYYGSFPALLLAGKRRIGTTKPRPLFFGQESVWLSRVCASLSMSLTSAQLRQKCQLSSDAPLALVEVIRDMTVLFTYCEHVACQGGASKSQETLVRDGKGRGQVGHVHRRRLGRGSCSWADAFVAWFLYECCVLSSLV